MNAILDQFSGKRRQSSDSPPPSIVPRTAVMSAPHDKTAQALAYVSALNSEVEQLRDENSRLHADLNISILRCQDLEKQMQVFAKDLEGYRRYSVEVRTHLQHIVDCAQRANEAALDAGERMPAEQAERVIAETEKQMREMSAADIGAKFGAGNGKREPG